MLSEFRNDPKLAGLALAAFGLVLLFAKVVYDLAARVSLAEKEYSAIMASGLISSSPREKEDRTLQERLAQSRPMEAAYRTAPLTGNAGQSIRQPQPGSDPSYRTAPLKEAP